MQTVYLGVKDSTENEQLSRICQQLGYAIYPFPTSDEIIDAMGKKVPDVLITDVAWLSDHFDIRWLNALKGGRKLGYWVVMGPDTIDTAIHWIRKGADTYIVSGWDDEKVISSLKKLRENEPVLSPLVSRKDLVLLQVIREISRNLDDLETLLNLTMDASIEISRSDYGSILIYQPEMNALEVRQQRGPSEPVDPTWGLFGISQARLLEWLQKKQSFVILDQSEYKKVSDDPNPEIHSLLIAPIVDNGERLGLFLLAKSVETGDMFNPIEVDVVQAFIHDLAPVIRNALIHARAQALNYKDDLTDAFNRRYFEQFLPEEIKKSERYGTKLSIIFLDLDNLKHVNENYGHLMGSKTLQEIAHRMILAVRGSDRVVRYGGDEFCIILPETDIEGARQVAERIRQEIVSRPFLTSEGLGIHITASFGIATFPTHGRTKDELVEAADRAMYEIKMTSKNAIKVAEPPHKSPQPSGQEA